MTRTQLFRLASRSARLNGVLALLAILSLVLFYLFLLIQASGDAEAGFPGSFFGPLNDLLTLLAALPLLVLAIAWFGLISERAGVAGRAALLFGILGSLGVMATMTLFVLGALSLVEQGIYFVLALGPLGLWRLHTSYHGRQDDVLPPRLARFGMIVGLSELIAFLAFSRFGGWSLLSNPDFSSALTNYPLLIGVFVGGLTGYLGGPIWSLGLARALGSAAKAIQDQAELPIGG